VKIGPVDPSTPLIINYIKFDENGANNLKKMALRVLKMWTCSQLTPRFVASIYKRKGGGKSMQSSTCSRIVH